MLCLPLGGVSVYEVLAAYLGLILSVVHVRHDQRGVQQLISSGRRRRWSCRTC